MPRPKLTPKQQEVVKLLDKGHDIPSAAAEMGITPSGVYGHIGRIRKAGIPLAVPPEKQTIAAKKRALQTIAEIPAPRPIRGDAVIMRYALDKTEVAALQEATNGHTEIPDDGVRAFIESAIDNCTARINAREEQIKSFEGKIEETRALRDAEAKHLLSLQAAIAAL
jgi:hypothetical protein